jgi:SH3-like domain-containing protein
MPLFLLTPVNRHASDWAFSSTCESVQIEAENEERARRRANLFFGVAARYTSGGRQLVSSPWDQRQLVTARVIEKPDPAVRLILAGDTPS